MTEAEWQTDSDASWMLTWSRSRFHTRKFRLLACGFCRRLDQFPTMQIEPAILEISERYADGETGTEQFEAVRRQIDWTKPGTAKYVVYSDAATAAEIVSRYGIQEYAEAAASSAAMRALSEEGDTADEAHAAAERAHAATLARARGEQSAVHVALVRCVLGNPFRSMTFSPSWLTPTAVALAEGI
ncbi:hypothetical protein [Limnoglobus roseus]|uniref:Uncharacterized protein n=1 Tax=Limnoglobus roseus TaxID=2598579 RepID=A0A5C1AH81_9BACT|nr:hypothetical protein [Limnoglobus roseus]QEL18170.1 hypothetical protein PX52LOC_05184 [Limnoglobus roseus]